MLVIISDLHLTDGTTGDTISTGAFEIFVERLQELAARASWRADGQYRPLESMDLVLLGDILDLTHSHRWLSTEARPWGDVQSAAVVQATRGILEEILEQHRPGIEMLHAITQGVGIRLPPAESSGRPAQGTAVLPVRVRAFYMVGNHDWLLHVRDHQYDSLRQRVVERFGLANAANDPFPHDPYESAELLSVLRRHRVLARHGDIFDPINYGATRDSASLGDALVIELVNRFTVHVVAELADRLPRAVVTGLSELPQIRPLLLIPVWLEGLLDRAGVHPELRQQLKRLWDQLADEFLQLPFVRQHDTWSPLQLVDGLERAIKFSKRISIGGAAKVAEWLQTLRGASSESYYQHALAEQDFRNRRARHIVYGHTHVAESVPLDASYADGYVLNQIYFNTGTWRRVFRQTQWSPREQEFVPTETMSYVAFYQGDERSGRSFETWTGTLATTLGDTPVRRLDLGRSSHAAEQLLPAPKVPPRAPHFRGPVSSSRITAAKRQ